MAVTTDTPSVGEQDTKKEVMLGGLIAEATALAEGGHPLGGFFSRLADFLGTL